MNTLSFKTISANAQTVNKEWITVDATGHSLGRLCSEIAKILRGKHKPSFTPHVDCGDYVIVINAEKAIMTGNKWTDRKYTTYSGYPGGQKVFNPARLRDKGWDRLYRKVVRGMLPKNRLGDKIINNLYIYEGEEHKHEAQKPRLVEIKSK